MNHYSDLKSYIDIMVSELNDLQENAKQHLSNIPKKGYMEWIWKNDDILQKYCLLIKTIKFDSDSDTQTAKDVTKKKYLETMETIYELKKNLQE